MITTLLAIVLQTNTVVTVTTVKALEKQDINEQSQNVLQLEMSEELSTTEDITNYITKTFADASVEALAIAKCESTYRPDAISPSGKHFGIFQIDKPTWDSNAEGIPWEKATDAKSNIDVAYKIYQQRGWQPWECRP